MIVKLKEKSEKYSDLSTDQPYYVIGIEADDFRILNDSGKPYLYPRELFDVTEPKEPEEWITEYGDEGERYSYPKPMLESGFFEDFFDGKEKTVSMFRHIVNSRLSQHASIA